MTDLVFRFPEDPQLRDLQMHIALAEQCLVSLTGTLPVRCSRSIDHQAEVRLARWIDHRQIDNDTLGLIESVIRKDNAAAERLARAMAIAYVSTAWVDPCVLEGTEVLDTIDEDFL
jgi:hypothetical protein